MVELSAVVSDATRVVEKDGLTAAHLAARSAGKMVASKVVM